MTKEMQDRVDKEYAKRMQRELWFYKGRFEVTPQVRDSMSYQTLALSIALQDVGNAFASLAQEAAAEIQRTLKKL